ncbi:MAG: MFS transporter [Ignavibacteriae bacterium]|nr:MFS transporter [Ignavibacteriota bacterium]
MNFLSTPRRRKFLFASLYLSEGAPIGFIWWALPTKLRSAGIPIDEITSLTSFLVLPWIFKFLWAPLIDSLHSQRWSLRYWILSTQLVMGVSLISLIDLDVQSRLGFVSALLMAHALAASTQDAAIDALAISLVPPNERGTLNGWMQVGMLTGRSLFGGGTLIFGTLFGEQAVIPFLIAAIWFSSIFLLMSHEPDIVHYETGSFLFRVTRFTATMKLALKRKSTWLGLLFAGCAGTAYEAVGSIAGPFLIDSGFTTTDVGIFFSLPSVLTMIGGAILGGYTSDKIGRKRSIQIFILTLVLDILLLAAFSSLPDGNQKAWMIGLLGGMYFCIGLFTSASYALFMDITDPKLGATQFSAFMGATNLCESWSTLAIGKFIPVVGYPIAFVTFSLVSLAALPILKSLIPLKSSSHSQP